MAAFRERLKGIAGKRSTEPSSPSAYRRSARRGAAAEQLLRVVENCRIEIREAEKMMKREGIRWLDSSTKVD